MASNDQMSMPGMNTRSSETLSERDRELMRRRIGIVEKRPAKHKKVM